MSLLGLVNDDCDIKYTSTERLPRMVHNRMIGTLTLPCFALTETGELLEKSPRLGSLNNYIY